MSKALYVARDGSYGSADGMVIVDCTGWTDDDWDRLEWATDDSMPEIALTIEREVRSRSTD